MFKAWKIATYRFMKMQETTNHFYENLVKDMQTPHWHILKYNVKRGTSERAK